MNKCTFPKDVATMLSEHRFGVLATYGGEYPYTSLISIAFANNFGTVVFPTLRETHKYENLCHESKVSVLLDNRSSENNPEKLYAVTILGVASETDAALHAEVKGLYLQRHPQLCDFVSLPQTALMSVTVTKLLVVEEFQKIREFDCSRGV